jgi:uncharacterized protein YceH (UPF0502 family)
MAFVDKAKEYLDAGMRASKDAISKAGSAVQEMGDKGMLKLEISRLAGRRKKLCAELGAKVLDAFCVQGAKSVTAKTPAAARLLEEIAALDEQISEKTQTLDAMSAAP